MESLEQIDPSAYYTAHTLGNTIESKQFFNPNSIRRLVRQKKIPSRRFGTKRYILGRNYIVWLYGPEMAKSFFERTKRTK